VSTGRSKKSDQGDNTIGTKTNVLELNKRDTSWNIQRCEERLITIDNRDKQKSKDYVDIKSRLEHLNEELTLLEK
jgi:hypothetical protein